MKTEKTLRMSFDPKTIEHLGIKMYSQLPNAMAELIANAYDACSTRVEIFLNDTDVNNMEIIVKDNGFGMTYDDINDKFLRIGRNRREAGDTKLPCERIPTGKKGLGKLAFFGIGEKIEVVALKDGIKTTFFLDWNELLKTPDGKDYEPRYITDGCPTDQHGVQIRLTNLKRKSKFDIEGLITSSAKLFNFPDRNFIVSVFHNDNHIKNIDGMLKYEGIDFEFQWSVPKQIDVEESNYEHKVEIVGQIMTTKKPLKPGLRGITLFANGRLVNNPEFFGSSESSHFFSYTVGWLDIDFVDNWETDVISTNRQSLEWDREETIELKNYLLLLISKIHYDWREKRKKQRQKQISEKSKIDIEKWFEKLPEEIESKVSSIVTKVSEDSELPEEDISEVVGNIHDLIPEYPYYHWRHLHKEVRDASETDYQNEDYYRAFIEASKRYITKSRSISGSTASKDASMMGEVYGSGKTLSVTSKYKKPDGTDFNSDTLRNIEEGQKFLSMGIVEGGRNPLSHEEIKNLRESGLFSEKDCLDDLSLLSHLFRRLENAIKI